MLQIPAPCSHRAFSADMAHEKDSVIRGPLRLEGRVVPTAGGMQVADVKRSTSFRMKKRGNVPPKLETLWHLLVKYKMVVGREAYVASRVIYVPPITGSEILA